MSYLDPQHWGDVDAGGDAMDWTTMKSKLLYPTNEMLRRAIEERWLVSGFGALADYVPLGGAYPLYQLDSGYVEALDLMGPGTIYTEPTAGIGRFLYAFQTAMSNLIAGWLPNFPQSPFVNHTANGGNWDGVFWNDPDPDPAFAPKWTEADILEAIRDQTIGNGMMASYTSGSEITVTLETDHELGNDSRVTVTWLQAGVPKTRIGVSISLAEPVATLSGGSGDSYPDDVGLAMVLKGGRILFGNSSQNIFRADWAVQQYKLLNMLRWRANDTNPDFFNNPNVDDVDGEEKKGLANDWDVCVANYIADPWSSLVVILSSAYSKNTAGHMNKQMRRTRSKAKINEDYPIKMDVDWYAKVNPEDPATFDSEGLGFDQGTYWLYETSEGYIVGDRPISGYPTDREDPYVKPPFPSSRTWAADPRYPVLKFDIIGGFQFMDK